MNENLVNIASDMKELGLAALAHVNNARLTEDKWSGILAVLQTAHAMEILAKARIAEEHPLLLFDEYPRLPKENNQLVDDLTLDQLAEKGKTIEWSNIIKMLWVTADIKTIDRDAFHNFGKIRNNIQHFGVVSTDSVSYLTSLSFIYSVIDPFINECWNLYAIDCCQDFDPELAEEDNRAYWSFIRDCLIQNEIKFLVSPTLVEYEALWWDDVKDAQSQEYRAYIQSQIDIFKDKQNLPV